MPELRKDLVHDKWVLIATEQALEPRFFPINRNGTYVRRDTVCPFCEGNESLTPPEIVAVRKNNSPPDSPGWLVRAIPSKYSAFKLEGDLLEGQTGIYHNCNGLGKQEVVIGNPVHNCQFHQFSLERIEIIYKVLKERYRALAADPRIKYIQIYKNQGLFAGASQEHSHSQIIALPMLPVHVPIQTTYYHENHKCLICAIIEQERGSGERIVYESEYFLLLSPYASRFSYETWIIPKEHKEHFGDISEEEIADLARTLKTFLTIMLGSLSDPSYNIVINTGPLNGVSSAGAHWFMEITPRFIVTNGFEMATGYYTNPVAPELSAALFRTAMQKDD